MAFTFDHYPVVVHHMGALDGAENLPNSMAAVQASLDVGAAVVEVDINALADEDYLLVHDDVLETETDGHGPVLASSAQFARGLRICHGGQLSEQPVPLLSQVVELFRADQGNTRLQLDFKNMIPFKDDEPLRRLVRLVEPIQERVIVSTGADWQLRKMRKLAPWLTLGFDIMQYIAWEPDAAQRDPREFPKLVGAYGYYDDHILASQAAMKTADYLSDRCESLLRQVENIAVFYLDFKMIAQSLTDGFNWAEALHAHGVLLDAWTMDASNPKAVNMAAPLLQAGVDLFTSNMPLAMGNLLAKSITGED